MSPITTKQMKNSYAILIALFIVGSTFAQAPEQMGYQAIVRDATGNLVTNQQVGMQISILQTTVGGTAVYIETQTPITNANGLVSIAIGTGTPVNGTFATIDWSADTYFIKTETDLTGGTSYSLINTRQLLSVPYALYANSATTAITAANGIPAGGANAQVLQMLGGVPTWIALSVFYKDTDGDSYGDIKNAMVAGAAPNGYIANNTDCNDTDFNEYPGQTWYIDADADGYGSTSIVACARAINGFLLSELLGSGTDDCDDTDPLINNTNQTWYIDADGDGYGGSSIVACARTVNAFLLSELLGSGTDDCNDTDTAINPTTVWYADLDGDGYGDATSSETGCTSTLTNATQDNTDCNDGDATINPGQNEIYGDGIDNNCDGIINETYAIGDFTAGGVVFYIASPPVDLDGDGDLDNGLVAAVTDQSAGIQWYNGAYIVTGATGTAIGTGASNTNAIIAAQGATETAYAAGLARAYRGGGFNNWFLPSKDELNAMYLNRAAINLTASANGGVDLALIYYWSSTEVDYFNAWKQYFSNGNQFNTNKSNYAYNSVRAVRAF